MSEKWKTIKENSNYEISNKGNVRNANTKHLLSFWKTTSGYQTVCLFNSGSQKTYYVHRLVANNYIDNNFNYAEVNHIDGNKENNNVNNLEWCSHKNNMRHAYKNNLIKPIRGKEHKRARKVKQINLINGEIKIWDCIIDAKREKNYSVGAICMACKNKIKTYKQSTWEYVN